MMMNNPQMELGLGEGAPFHSRNVRTRRQGKARWWFDRMRQVVDRAFDWQPAPVPPPEQIWFENGYRRAGAAGAASSSAPHREEERQICE